MTSDASAGRSLKVVKSAAVPAMMAHVRVNEVRLGHRRRGSALVPVPPEGAARMTAKVTNLRPPRRRWGRLLWIALALVLLLLLLDTIYVALRLPGALTTVAEALNRARQQIDEGQLEEARVSTSEAVEEAHKARELAGHPAMKVLRWMPVVGSEARVVEAVTEAAVSSSKGADQGVVLLEHATEPGKEIGSGLYSRGKLDVAAVERLTPLIEGVAGLFSSAKAELLDAPRSRLGLVRERTDEALARVTEAGTTAARGRGAFRLLPSILGGDGPRRYFLAFQTPSEARGTGGLIGFYGILVADDGELELEEVAPIGELAKPRGKVEAPQWFALHYGALGALREWQQVNLSPHFPQVAEIILRMYRSATGEELDGVIAMDPIVLGELSRGTGPVAVPELDAEIDRSNAAEVLLRDAYRFSDARQDRALTRLIERFLEELKAPDVNIKGVAEGFGESITSQHFKMFSKEGETQRRIEDLGLDGWSADADLQAIWHTSASVSKVDYFLRRRLGIEVELLPGDRVRVTNRVKLTNSAPTGPRSLLNSPGYKGDPKGLNRMYLNFMLPIGAEESVFAIDGVNRVPVVAEEEDHQVVWDVVKVRAGTSRTVSASYVMPLHLEADGRLSFSMVLQPQAAVRPDPYTLTVKAPPGTAVSGEGVEAVSPGAFKSHGLLDREQQISLGFRELR